MEGFFFAIFICCVIIYLFELGGRHVFCIIIQVVLYVLNPLLGYIE